MKIFRSGREHLRIRSQISRFCLEFVELGLVCLKLLSKVTVLISWPRMAGFLEKTKIRTIKIRSRLFKNGQQDLEKKMAWQWQKKMAEKDGRLRKFP